MPDKLVSMKAAIYARVSTKDQETENQLLQLRSYATSQAWAITEYIDYQTGKHSDRVQLKAMFEAASKREIDVVLFWSLDRFTREGALPTLQHLNRLSEYGVGFRSFTEPYLDSCGIFKDAVIAILGTIAKQERVRIVERTRAGLDRAKAAGKVLGRPNRVFRRDEAVRLRKSGMSWRGIGQQLGVPFMTVKRAVSESLSLGGQTAVAKSA